MDLPLLMLPGLMCDEAVWSGVRRLLPPERETIVPCYRDLDRIEAMADEVLRQAPPGRFCVAGHSMGGRIALEVMRRAPERVARIALLNTGTDPIAAGAAGDAERAHRQALVNLARGNGMRAMAWEWARNMVHPARLVSPVFERILDMVERHAPEQFEAQVRALLARPDARDVFASIRCPTLLLCGREDTWSPLARHQRMREQLPHAWLVAVEECGHMSPMEQPRAVAMALSQWLAAE